MDEQFKEVALVKSQPESKSRSSVLREAEIDPIAEKKLVRKLDLILLPLSTIAHCANFIDRTAIGNAKIAGIEKDLGMTGSDYNIALTVFYLFYVAVDIPSNLALKRFGSVWLAAMIICFGATSVGTAFVKSYTTFIVTRVFLGLTEGGTLSGLAYILSNYYRRSELVLRIGFFVGISPSLAGAFGGLLASGLLAVPDLGVVKSWRKIFLVEGIITVGFGLLCVLIFPTHPEHTRMLNEEERALALARIDADQAVSTHGRKEPTSVRLVLRAFSLHTVVCVICYVMLNISFQGLSLFMPTVIATLGHYTVIESQLRTVPPYIVGGVWAVSMSYYGYRTKQRAVPIILSGFLMITGYGIAIGTKNTRARYAACFFSISGAAFSGPMYLTWGADNAAPDTVRVVVTALIPGLGALGSLIAVWTYLPADAPNYHNGNSLNLATSTAVVFLTFLNLMYLRWENSNRDRGERDYRLDGKSTEELKELGYLHPNFRYQT